MWLKINIEDINGENDMTLSIVCFVQEQVPSQRAVRRLGSTAGEVD